MALAWVYMLRCADGSYFAGHTANIEASLAAHQAGRGDAWTRARLPVELVFFRQFPDAAMAALVAEQIKSWPPEKQAALAAEQANKPRAPKN